MKRFLTGVVGLVGTFALNAADGVWYSDVGGGGNWETESRWENNVVAGGEADDTAYLHVNSTGKTLTINADVILNRIVNLGTHGCYVTLQRSPDAPEATFRMSGNPSITAAPVWNHSQRFILNGDNIVTGDGVTALTVQGGQFNVSGTTQGNYSFANFPRVDLKDMFSISLLAAGGITGGDLRLCGTRLNFDYGNSDLTVTNNFVGGKLIVGSGMNYSRMGIKGPIRYPATVVREKAGVFTMLKGGANAAYSLSAPLEAYTRGKNRFPTWWLFADGSQNVFLTYNEREGFTNANLTATVALGDSTKEDAVVLAGATTLAQDAEAAAVQIKGGHLNLAGRTLTLGNESEPGLLILHGGGVNGADGTVKFEGADGILVSNGADRRIRAKLVGTNSITVVAGVEEVVHWLCLDNPENSFSGGLDVLVGYLSVTNANSLGTGPVRVHGYPANFDYGAACVYSGSGSLYVNGCTVTNDLILAGMGPARNELGSGSGAALILQNGATVKGPITLENDTAIRVGANAATACVESPIRGAHEVCFTPGLNSVIKFAGEIGADSSVQINGAMAKPTNARSLGTVLLAATGSLGGNAVKNNGTLVFENSRTMSNPLTGEGSYKQTSDIDVVFAGAVNQQGGILAEKGTITLQAAENALGGLAGVGTINVAGTSTLTLGMNDKCYDSYFQGDIATMDGGRLTLVKAGAGTQIFANPLSFTGDVVVEGGTLRLGGIGTELPKTVFAPQVHADATDAANVVTGDDDTVETWLNTGAVDADFVQPIEEKKPIYDPNAMNGKGGIVFRGSMTGKEYASSYVTNRLYLANDGAQANALIEKAFIAFSVRNQTMFGAPIGEFGKDNGLRLGYDNYAYNENGGSFVFDRLVQRDSQNYLLNGEKTKNGTCHRNNVFEQSTGSRLNWCVALGQHFDEGANRPRAFNGAIGEVLLFGVELNPQEEFTVRAYFNNKWGITTDAHAAKDILPVGSALMVKEGAMVDFAGVSQTLARLENYGTITNSSATPVVVTVKDAVLAGKIAGNVKVVIDGGQAYLKTWRNMVELPVKANLAFHLDAAKLPSLLRNAEGQVTNWVDRSENQMDFRDDVDGLSHKEAILPPPTFDSTLYGGRGGVKFVANQTDADGANRLTLGEGKSCVVKTVFIVTQTDKWTYFGGLIGPRNGDDCLRLSSSQNSFSWGPYGSFSGTEFYLNGNKGVKKFTQGKPHLVQACLADGKDGNKTWTLGQYFKVEVADTTASNFATVGGLRGYCGSVAEVVAYGEFVSEEERLAITRYLTDKWMAAEVNLDEKVLEDGVKIGLLNGATLDLGDTAQTVGGFSGSGGTVVNGDLTIGGALEVDFDDNGEVVAHAFNGATLADGLQIVLNGQPSALRFVIATGVKSADVSTFKLPASSWKVSLKNGELSLAKGGMVIIVR